MLKKFFLNFLSSFVGAWVALGLFCLTAAILIFSLIGKAGLQQSTAESVKSHSVLLLDLEGIVEEREMPADVDYMTIINGDFNSPQTLTTLRSAIREAATNSDVDMIYLKCAGVQAGTATLHALRSELAEFRKSGKKIYAYSDAMYNSDYYLASVADSIFLNPAGHVALTGLEAQAVYFKDFLDKIGVKIQVSKVGTYKSAVEPYISNEMSAPARAQLDTLLGNVWQLIRTEIGADRKISPSELNKLVSTGNLMLQDAEFYVKNKLVDRLAYERTMDDRISRAVGVDKKKLNYVSASTLSAANIDALASLSSKEQIAVLYACGEIREGTKNGINCEVLVPVITKLADDESVKGMVLRVNSPGGSVFGSEQIAEALAYFQSKGKPLAVSMGDYAASGGYWISCHADRIFADPMTITGSIGIFGMFPEVSALAAKVGVTPQTIATNPGANYPSLFEPMTPAQMEAMQTYIDAGYDKFVNRVASGRKLSEAKVRAIAEGRVWDGKKALSLGLVDELGQLNDAVEWVKTKATEKGAKNLGVVNYPEMESGFWDMVRMSMQSETRVALIREVIKLAPEAAYAEEAANIIRRKPIQARMVPFVIGNVQMR